MVISKTSTVNMELFLRLKKVQESILDSKNSEVKSFSEISDKFKYYDNVIESTFKYLEQTDIQVSEEIIVSNGTFKLTHPAVNCELLNFNTAKTTLVGVPYYLDVISLDETGIEFKLISDNDKQFDGYKIKVQYLTNIKLG